jgi:hypothetical protein
MLDRSLDGDLFPGENVQQLVSEVVTALPGLVASYSDEQGAEVERIRELTDRCFRMASTGGKDLAEQIPSIQGVISSTGGNVEKSSASETLAH